MFAAMAAWCEANGVEHDVYGSGAADPGFERKVAELLGFEAAVFCISGTMAQVTALRLACDGPRQRAWWRCTRPPTSSSTSAPTTRCSATSTRCRWATASPVDAWPTSRGARTGWRRRPRDPDARDRRPALPWDDLEPSRPTARRAAPTCTWTARACGKRRRLWPQRMAEIAAGFDSVYVSLYKGIGGLGGAMLLGSRAFVDRAAEWFKRQGGNVIHRSPYVVAAAMQFDERLAACRPTSAAPSSCTRCCARIRPSASIRRGPQANMLHLHLPVSRERALEIRRRWPSATASGCSTASRTASCPTPASSSCMWATTCSSAGRAGARMALLAALRPAGHRLK
jgi:hypothetical protein